jgi:hypothetical protein
MKRIAVHIAIILGLIIPLTSPASATEKCLASFPDSEWSNGTPAGVRSLLGFDLVESIARTKVFLINSYYVYGEHNEKITYTYSGKNCSNRVVVISKPINQQTLSFKHQTLNDYINKNARNFLILENSVKYYTEVRDGFAQKSFMVSKEKSARPNFQVAILPVMKAVDGLATKYERNVVRLDYPFIHFPNKCGYFLELNTADGSIGQERMYAAPASNFGFRYSMLFETSGDCIGELRQGGQNDLAEKIADIRYVVTDPAAPAVITCKKGKVTTKVKSANAKCPKGFKKV